MLDSIDADFYQDLYLVFYTAVDKISQKMDYVQMSDDLSCVNKVTTKVIYNSNDVRVILSGPKANNLTCNIPSIMYINYSMIALAGS